jgi:hypothetical protein
VINHIPCGDVSFSALCVAAEEIVENKPSMEAVMSSLVPDADCEPDAYGLWIDKIAANDLDAAIEACELLAKACDAMAEAYADDLHNDDKADPPCMPFQARAAAQAARIAREFLRSDARTSHASATNDIDTWTPSEVARDGIISSVSLDGPRGLTARLWIGSGGRDSVRVRFFHEMPGHAAAEGARFLAHLFEITGEAEAGNVDADFDVIEANPSPSAFLALEGPDAIVTAIAYFGDPLVDALKAGGAL